MRDLYSRFVCVCVYIKLIIFFFKVCNHPELFERREAKSPLFFHCPEYVLPKLLFDDGLLHLVMPSKDHLLYNRLSIFAMEYIHRSLFPVEPTQGKIEVCYCGMCAVISVTYFTV